MKVTFEFDTDSETFQSDEYERVLKADDMAAFIWDMMEAVRGWYNHHERYEALTEDSLSEKFWSLMDQHKIDIDRLWP